MQTPPNKRNIFVHKTTVFQSCVIIIIIALQQQNKSTEAWKNKKPAMPTAMSAFITTRTVDSSVTTNVKIYAHCTRSVNKYKHCKIVYP